MTPALDGPTHLLQTGSALCMVQWCCQSTTGNLQALQAMMQVMHRLPCAMQVFNARSMHARSYLVTPTRRLALQAMRQSHRMPCMACCVCRRPAAPLARAASIALIYWAVCRRGTPVCKCCMICSMSVIAPAAVILHVWPDFFAPLCGPS